MSKINYYRNVLLGKEELTAVDKMMRRNIFQYLSSINGTSRSKFPLIDGLSSDLLVTKTGSVNEVAINSGYILELDNADNSTNEYEGGTLQLDSDFTPADGDVRYVVLNSSEVDYEVDVTATVTAASNQLTITNGSIDDLVRDLSNTDATKIKFYKDSGLVNTGTYTIINRIDSSNYIIDGSLTDESGVGIKIIGTYDLSKVIPSNSIYTNTQFTPDVDTFSGFISSNSVLLAKIEWSSSTVFTITDLRDRYSLSNILLSISSDYVNPFQVGNLIKGENKFQDNIHFAANKIEYFSNTLTLSSSSITIPSSKYYVDDSDFDDVYSIYKIEGTTSNSTIDTINLTNSVVNGLSFKILVTGTRDVIFSTISSQTANKIYTPQASDVAVSPGNIVDLIINENDVFVLSSIDPSSISPLSFKANITETRELSIDNKFVTPSSLGGMVPNISETVEQSTSNRFLTPSNLVSLRATESETLAQEVYNKFVTPGTISELIANSTQILVGEDNKRYITPKALADTPSALLEIDFYDSTGTTLRGKLRLRKWKSMVTGVYNIESTVATSSFFDVYDETGTLILIPESWRPYYGFTQIQEIGSQVNAISIKAAGTVEVIGSDATNGRGVSVAYTIE